VVNFRVLPGDTIASVTEHVRRTVDDERISVKDYARGIGFIVRLIRNSDSGSG
jgi:hypothetical protein